MHPGTGGEKESTSARVRPLARTESGAKLPKQSGTAKEPSSLRDEGFFHSTERKMSMFFSNLRSEIKAVFERDPAAKTCWRSCSVIPASMLCLPTA